MHFTGVNPIADVVKLSTGRFVNNTGWRVRLVSTHARSKVTNRVTVLPGCTVTLRDPDCSHVLEPAP